MEDSSLSIVIPFFNEEGSVLAVLEEIRSIAPHAEIIAVNDGSTDTTSSLLRTVSGIRLAEFTQNRGQSAAIRHGIHLATRTYIALLDGDGQNDPGDLPKLLEKAAADVVVCGVRTNRKDSRSKVLAGKFANWVRKLLLHDGVVDTGCSLKIFPAEVARYLPGFDGMHRFLPALLSAQGLRVINLEVNHRPRLSGVSHYTNAGRALRGLADLFGVWWLRKRMFRGGEHPKSSRAALTEVPKILR